MRFLVDRCAGRRLAEWLRQTGHDVLESSSLGADPGDLALLQMAALEKRILVTIDTDFGKLVFVDAIPHCGVIRLPDVPAAARIALLDQVLQRHAEEELTQSIVTVRGATIRISKPPAAKTAGEDS